MLVGGVLADLTVLQHVKTWGRVNQEVTESGKRHAYPSPMLCDGSGSTTRVCGHELVLCDGQER